MNIEQKVASLIADRAKHLKKGMVMGEETWKDVFDHLKEEIIEFRCELGACHTARQLEELGDIYGIFVHMVLKAGFTLSQVEQRELAKLDERFATPALPAQPVGESG